MIVERGIEYGPYTAKEQEVLRAADSMLSAALSDYVVRVRANPYGEAYERGVELRFLVSGEIDWAGGVVVGLDMWEDVADRESFVRNWAARIAHKVRAAASGERD